MCELSLAIALSYVSSRDFLGNRARSWRVCAKKSVPADVVCWKVWSKTLIERHQKVSKQSPVEILQRRYGESHFYDLSQGVPDIAPFGFVLDRFAEKAGDREMPAWRDFKIQDLLGWHADMMLIEIMPDGKDGFCRIVGDRIGPHFESVVQHNKTLSESGSPVVPRLLEHFERLLMTPAIAHFHGRIDYEGKDHIALEVIDMPLTDTDGMPRYVLSFGRRMRAAAPAPQH